MSGPIPIRAGTLPRKQFQNTAATAIDRQAQALGLLHQKLQQQGEVLADLCVARDQTREALVAFQSVTSVWGRLRWLVIGK